MTSKVHMIVGYPASGKSTLAQTMKDDGYEILNRDTIGGKIIDLVPRMVNMINSGKKIVLDNTFATAKVRKPFIEAAQSLGVEVCCTIMGTTIEQAQWGACSRMIERYGKILSPQEIKDSKDPNMFPPAVLFKYRKEYEKPSKNEGFSKIDTCPYVLRLPSDCTGKAIILDYDGTLRDTKSGAKWPRDPEDVYALPNRKEVLQKYIDDGYILLGASNQSGVAKNQPTEDICIACFERTNELLGIDIEIGYCPHKVPPISCYCRKPMPGMGVRWVLKHKLDPKKCIMVGDATSDKTFAKRCGFEFKHADDFFLVPAGVNR